MPELEPVLTTPATTPDDARRLRPGRTDLQPGTRSYGPKRRQQGLSDRQRLFADQFLVHLNAAKAAREAGYSQKSAGEIGWQLLNTPKIESYIRERQARQAAELKLTPHYVLARLHELAQKCAADVPVLDRHGKETGEYRLDSAGAKGALELIGKYLGMFGDRIDHTLTVRLEDLSEAQVMAMLGRMPAVDGQAQPVEPVTQPPQAQIEAPKDDGHTDDKP